VKTTPEFEFPPDQKTAYRKARRLAWITIVYLFSVSVVMYLAMGSSQAMKTAWLEDILSLVPSAVFLIASRIAVWPPSERFPYGFHRAVSIAFLAASVALFVMGIWLLMEAIVKLIQQEHPTIGGVHLFGQTFWLGWIMLPALVWSAVPAMILGRMKLPVAAQIHDKVLHTDAQMQKADWLTALAAMIGVLGVGMGYWWADATAAAVISIDILRDGFRNVKQVVFDLIDERPTTVDRSHPDELPDRMRRRLKSFPWIKDAAVRMREEGHVYFGEAFVVVSDETDLTEKLRRAVEDCINLNWRVHDLVITPVHSLEDEHRHNDESRPPSQEPSTAERR
jgi:cation diffusion facilitator family transporter